jgi:hypothetical protein
LLDVLIGDSLLILVFPSLIFFLGLASDFNFADSVSGDIDIIDTVLEFRGHLVSMLMERLLQSIFIVPSNFNFEKFSLWVFHHPVEVLSPHSKPFNMVDRLIQEL